MKSIRLNVQRKHLLLTAERAVFWQQQKILLIADPHFGKAASFRSAGIGIPSGTTRDDLNRLAALIVKYEPRKLIVLGDLIHSASSKSREVMHQFKKWRAAFSDIEMILIQGNHDRDAGNPPTEFKFDRIEKKIHIGSALLSHKPVVHAGCYTIAGHVHPAVRLKGIAGHIEIFPCFYFSPQFAILPAFGSFTGYHMIKPSAEDRIYIVAGNEIIKALPAGHHDR
jgi:DNA ligase-associated metallophosphoesterase